MLRVLTTGQNHLAQRLFYNKVLIVSGSLFDPVLKWTAEWLCRYRMTRFVCLLWWLSGSLVTVVHCLAQHHRNILQHTASPGKDQNLKFGICWMCITFTPSEIRILVSRLSPVGNVCIWKICGGFSSQKVVSIFNWCWSAYGNMKVCFYSKTIFSLFAKTITSKIY